MTTCWVCGREWSGQPAADGDTIACCWPNRMECLERGVQRLIAAGKAFTEHMATLHCPECGTQWGEDSPDDMGNERCDGCVSEHKALRAAQVAFRLRPAAGRIP